MHKQKFSLAVAVAAFVAVGTVTVPAQAALLDFDFTSVSGVTGSFTLNTNIPPSPVPSFGTGPGNPGVIYPNAISNLIFSSPQINVSGENADWGIVPSIVLGPPSSPVLSSILYPLGCSTTTSFVCTINVGVGYAGALSKLSDDPNSYRIGLGIELFDSTNNFQSFGREPFISYQVVRRKAVPEPNTYLGTLALGVCGVALQMKRKMKTKRYRDKGKDVLCNPVSIEG
ncbi:PEP-CTERM sorting domain-containing protein [Rivularia sp. UHCC 0363]|uniref:PEP-CTERM sorting domain-containing protein n=1 Tax=Rivularia sp. UHCC 0363 TaxID=3110244 RepID=UPI002B2198E9|nr:PEP-CTERM sorting domain-containing protein [Rivularia sp. UHCC 0363]MEA5595751.1 PEP-CTERM sorting domain-containing protein [Rivularia sp. UHCC 0363]